MGSRVRCRKTVKRLFECFITVETPWSQAQVQSDSWTPNEIKKVHPVIQSVFPASFKNEDILRTSAQFAFPCPSESETVEVFTFVLTSGDSKWTFGYCRHPPGAPTCTIFLSFLPWQEIFYRSLNFCAELPNTSLVTFLERMYSVPVPDAGTCLYVPMVPKAFICPCPSDHALASIPENRNASEFYNALRTDSMLKLFAALLSERRIVVTSKKVARLSSVVVACNVFLFPMSWQHIFIPVLPISLQDYLAAPMPFLIGVPIRVWNRIPTDSIGQVVRVDADTDTVTTPFAEDLESLPDDIQSSLRKNLAGERVLGDGLSRAFLRALALLMGHYRDAIRDDDLSFDPNMFVQFAHPGHRNFIESKLLGLQIFQQFIEDRIERIKTGECESDEFELESLAWRSHNRSNGKLALRSIAGRENRTAIKKAGKAVMMSMKRESGNLIETVKQNSALKSALRTVKESGKTVKQKGQIAYSDIRSKFHVAPSSVYSRREGPIPFDYGQSQSTKSYRRQGSSSINTPNSTLEEMKVGSSAHSAHVRTSDSDDNLVHLMSTTGGLNELPGHENGKVGIQPRLSKSEENLIDLDSPDSMRGFNMENPVYDLVTNNSVFEDEFEGFKTDEQLLKEYGLNDYFSQLNISGTSVSSNGSSGFDGATQQSSKSNWATFE